MHAIVGEVGIQFALTILLLVVNRTQAANAGSVLCTISSRQPNGCAPEIVNGVQAFEVYSPNKRILLQATPSSDKQYEANERLTDSINRTTTFETMSVAILSLNSNDTMERLFQMDIALAVPSVTAISTLEASSVESNATCVGTDWEQQLYPELFPTTSIESIETKSTWKPVWGEVDTVDDWYTVAKANFTVMSSYIVEINNENTMERDALLVAEFEFRVYPYGVSYRILAVHGSENNAEDTSVSSTQFSETIQLEFDAGYTDVDKYQHESCVRDKAPTVWSVGNSEQFIGPVLLSNFVEKRREFYTTNYPAHGCETPVVFKLDPLQQDTAELSEWHLAFHEAGLKQSNPLSVENGGDSMFQLTTTHTPSSKSTKNLASGKLTTQKVESAWRYVIIGSSASELIERSSDLVLNLNEERSFDVDWSWVKTGLSAWDWRIRGAQRNQDALYGIDMPSMKSQIDFIGKTKTSQGQFMLLDGGWYGKADKDSPMTSIPQLDVPVLVQYGVERNVGIILYVHDAVLRKENLNNLLSTYKNWGVVGIKHGFVSGGLGDRTEHALNVLRACAQHELLYQVHEPNKPTGLRRTYPNFLSSEYVSALLDDPLRRPASPTDVVTFPFVHGLAGPLDRSPGLFALDTAITRDKAFRQIPSTIISQVAQGLIYFTGVWNLVDTPEVYGQHQNLFNFISQLPMTWSYSSVLEANIGKYITVARRHNSTIYIASLTNETPRKTEIVVSHLLRKVRCELNMQCSDAKFYSLTLYSDADDASFEFDGPTLKIEGAVPVVTTRENYMIQRYYCLTAQSVIALNLAAGGGSAAILRPLNVNETSSLITFESEVSVVMNNSTFCDQDLYSNTPTISPTKQPDVTVPPTIRTNATVPPTNQTTAINQTSLVPTLSPSFETGARSFAPTQSPTKRELTGKASTTRLNHICASLFLLITLLVTNSN